MDKETLSHYGLILIVKVLNPPALRADTAQRSSLL